MVANEPLPRRGNVGCEPDPYTQMLEDAVAEGLMERVEVDGQVKYRVTAKGREVANPEADPDEL